jgi:SAM-dependent methyltransferase
VVRTIACPLCGGSDHAPVCAKRRGAASYSCVRCASCGFYFVNPEPDAAELDAAYDAEYSERHAGVWHGAEDGLNRRIIARLRRLGVTALVDLGAGQGRFVRSALDAGLRASGVEPSRLNCDAALQRYGVSLANASVDRYLREAAAPSPCFTMLNVFEHLPDPVGVLRRLGARLSPGGVLLLVVPNVDFTLALGALRRPLGFRDVFMLESPRFSQQGFDPPIHLSSFSARTLERALAGAGLRVEALEQAPVIASSDPVSRLAKSGVRAAGAALQWVSRGRLVFGYSLLAVARPGAS